MGKKKKLAIKDIKNRRRKNNLIYLNEEDEKKKIYFWKNYSMRFFFSFKIVESSILLYYSLYILINSGKDKMKIVGKYIYVEEKLEFSKFSS